MQKAYRVDEQSLAFHSLKSVIATQFLFVLPYG